MKSFVLLISFTLTSIISFGTDSLRVTMSSTSLKRGEILDFQCTIPDVNALKLTSATLNVWIDDLEKNKRWKFRYPIINGEVSASLAVSDKITDGKYAVNFLVQRGFFKFMGEVVDHNKKDSLINYMMIPRNKKASYFDNTRVLPDGSFRLKSTLFEDSAYFIFTPLQKVKNNDLLIRIETPLDSFFTPVLASTRFITVGNTKMPVAANDPFLTNTNTYTFNADDPVDKTLLPGVTVIGKIKKKVEQFDDENSRGLFKRDDAIIFDGLDSDQIGRSFTVFQFLQGKVPGLTIEKDSVGQEVGKWRNEIVEIYVDEFRMEAGDHLFVIPTDIAMIKVFRPPAQLSSFSGGAGAIALYTKKGRYATANSRHNFIVKGYTSLESTWE